MLGKEDSTSPAHSPPVHQFTASLQHLPSPCPSPGQRLTERQFFYHFYLFLSPQILPKEGACHLPGREQLCELCGSTLSKADSPGLAGYRHLVWRDPCFMVKQTTFQVCTAGGEFPV